MSLIGPNQVVQALSHIKVAQKEAKIYVRRHIKINWKKQVKEIDGHKRLLAIKEKALGPNYPDVATSLNNLVRLYETQGEYALAEPLKRRSRAIRSLRKLLESMGSDHPDVATSLDNLAELYRVQGEYALARPLQRRSQAIGSLRKLLERMGSDHPDVAKSLNNLAALYETQGQYAQAEPLYKRSQAIREQSLGPDHPDVAKSLNNLAKLQSGKKKLKH